MEIAEQLELRSSSDDNSAAESAGAHVPVALQPAEPTEQVRKSFTIKIDLQCKKCGREFQTDFFPYAPPFIVLTRGAALAPYLQKILDETNGPQPELIRIDQMPSTVPSCSACNRHRLPREGDTFRKKLYRGKFHTIGRPRNDGKSGTLPESDPENTYDIADQRLTVAHRCSRYGKGIDYANKQSRIREWLHRPEQLAQASKVLDGMSLRDVEQRWDIPRMTAGRGKAEIESQAAIPALDDADEWDSFSEILSLADSVG